MISDTTLYFRKEVKSAHRIEALYMYFNGSGIWDGETMKACAWAILGDVTCGT